jgi:hypothetical protein
MVFWGVADSSVGARAASRSSSDDAADDAVAVNDKFDIRLRFCPAADVLFARAADLLGVASRFSWFDAESSVS